MAMKLTPPPPSATTTTNAAPLRGSLVVEALWPCAFYFVCSFAMNMLTKTLITSYKWHAIYSLGAIQNIFTMVAIGAYLLAAKLFTGSNTTQQPANKIPASPAATTTTRPHRSWRVVVRVLLPLVALHIGNMVLGFAAMRVVNMPMYLVLRRLTTIKVLLIEWLVLHKELPTTIKLALLVSTTGSLIAGSSDATFEPLGYLLVILQNICSACSLTFAKESALSSQQIVLMNSIAGSFVCAWLAYLFEYDTVIRSSLSLIDDVVFVGLVALMCCVCVLYQFAIMICTIRNSALATSVTGNVKDLASTVCGFAFFPDVQIRTANVVGVSVSLLGAYLFSYVKFLTLTQTVDVLPTGDSKQEEKAGHLKTQ